MRWSYLREDNSLQLISRFLREVFPEVDYQLNQWMNRCSEIKDEMLKNQAISSITQKKFHAQGGCIYSLYPGIHQRETLCFIIALQTISDYLDNLCDRAGVFDEAAFRQLHRAISDAVTPYIETCDYYQYYPFKNDNGYLNHLVKTCRLQLQRLPSFKKVTDAINKYADYYTNLQTYKHLPVDVREKSLKTWACIHSVGYPEIYWWEFAAAAGSTLAIFMLIAVAFDPNLSAKEIETIEKAYFPWVCGLHILLDYFIDSHEDLRGGDLNFTSYYPNADFCKERLIFFLRQSLSKCAALRYPQFHYTVIQGLLAMYLTDPKASVKEKKAISHCLVRQGGWKARLYFHICKLLRSLGKL